MKSRLAFSLAIMSEHLAAGVPAVAVLARERTTRLSTGTSDVATTVPADLFLSSCRAKLRDFPAVDLN
jgi:hypothetical protein